MSARNNYGDEHVITQDPLLAIRHRPGYHVGAVTELMSQWQIAKEVTDNNFDEANLTADVADTIVISIYKDKSRYQVVCTDTGRGMPLKKMLAMLTVPNTSGKWVGAYNASSGTFGMGLKATVALSKHFTAISRRSEGYRIIGVDEGIATFDKHTKYPRRKPKEPSGTTIIYEPDPKIFTGIDKFMTDPEGFKAFVDKIDFASAFSRNTRTVIQVIDGIIPLKDIRKADPLHVWATHRIIQDSHVVYDGKDRSFYEYISSKYRVGNPIWDMPEIRKDIDPGDENDMVGYRINMFLTEDARRYDMIIGSINGNPIHNPNGHHVVGVVEAVKAQVAPFVPAEQHSFFMNIYRLPLALGAIADYRNAEFDDPKKTNFTDRDFLKRYSALLNKEMSRIKKAHWQLLYELIEQDIDDKYTAYYKKQTAASARGSKFITIDLEDPDAFIDCEEDDPSRCEILFTEGDSAGNHVKKARDAETQAVYKFQGKCTNFIQMTLEKIRTNKLDTGKLFRDCCKILGVGPEDRDLSGLRFKQIGIMADADVDGYHIANLMISLLYRINPLLLTQGKVFVVNTPLWAIVTGKSVTYLKDNAELINMQVRYIYEPEIELKMVTVGGEQDQLKGRKYMTFAKLTRRFGSYFTAISDRLSIDPIVLEGLAACYRSVRPGHINPERIKRTMKLDKVEYNKAGNYLLLNKGDIDVVVSLDRLYNELMTVVPDLLKVQWNKFHIEWRAYASDDQEFKPISFVRLYQFFEKLNTVYSSLRFKGLGAMDKAHLRQTCVDPKTREVTYIKSVGEFARLHDLMGTNPATRKQLVSAAISEAEDY